MVLECAWRGPTVPSRVWTRPSLGVRVLSDGLERQIDCVYRGIVTNLVLTPVTVRRF